MLSPLNPRCFHAPVTTSLNDLVLQNNDYWHLEPKLDLGFIRECVKEF